jgi:hypothetical protein
VQVRGQFRKSRNWPLDRLLEIREKYWADAGDQFGA